MKSKMSGIRRQYGAFCQVSVWCWPFRYRPLSAAPSVLAGWVLSGCQQSKAQTVLFEVPEVAVERH